MKAGINVYFFSLEMPRSDMIARLVSIQTGLPLFDILQRRLDDDQVREIVGALPNLSELPGNWTEEDNLKLMSELFGQIGPNSRSIAYVDFLGLMRLPGMDASQQYAVTTEAGLMLKRAAMSLHIPIVAGVQLNRDVEKRKQKHPILSDFRDSGRLEEIGDVCLGLYRPGYKPDSYDNSQDTELQVFCLKHRNGPRVNYVLEWHGPCARAKEKTKLSWTEVA
jgi:replicative DNA helicase